MNFSSEDFFIYLGVLGLSIIVYYTFTQWVHQIQKRNRYLKAQIELLARIAERQGVPKEEIESVVFVAEKKEKPMGLK